jgi:hypothetical protein
MLSSALLLCGHGFTKRQSGCYATSGKRGQTKHWYGRTNSGYTGVDQASYLDQDPDASDRTSPRAPTRNSPDPVACATKKPEDERDRGVGGVGLTLARRTQRPSRESLSRSQRTGWLIHRRRQRATRRTP